MSGGGGQPEDTAPRLVDLYRGIYMDKEDSDQIMAGEGVEAFAKVRALFTTDG